MVIKAPAAGIASALIGVIAWIVPAWMAGTPEAWDAGLYLAVALPALWLGCLLLGHFAPRPAWRWGAIAAIVHAAAAEAVMLRGSEPGPLMPLGLCVLAANAIPCTLAATLGGRAARTKNQ